MKNVSVDEYKKQFKSSSNPSKNKPMDSKKREKVANEIKQRHRFVKQNIKLQRIDISLIRKFDELKVFPYSYANDMIGSFFFDEIETLNMAHKTPKFREWYNEIIDISQSLPLILNNKTKILHHILDK